MPHTMTPDEIRDFLGHGTRTAKLATSLPDGQPHVMPVWFVLDGVELPPELVGTALDPAFSGEIPTKAEIDVAMKAIKAARPIKIATFEC